MGTRAIIKNLKYLSLLVLAFVFAAQDTEAATLSKPANNLGLVSYLSFNDATGTVATDFSGNRNSGTLVDMSHPATASSGWGIGKFGSGVSFDGNNDYVNLSTVADNITEGSFAVSTWLRCAPGVVDATIWGINNFDAEDNKSGVFLDTSSRLYVWDGGDEDLEIQSLINVCDNSWHHAVYSREGSTGTLYVDGQSQGTHTANDTFASDDWWAIGAEPEPGPVISFLLNGKIDEFRVYSRPLSEADVIALYRSGLVTINSSQNNLVKNGLVGYWTYDGADTTDKVYDKSISGNNGYVYNSATSTVKKVGKIGQGMTFDGIDDFVYQDLTSLGTLTSGSVALWVYRNRNNTYEMVFESGVSSPSIEGDTGLILYVDNVCGATFLGIAVGEWQYLVGTWDGTNVRAYVNGVLVDTNACTNSNPMGFTAIGARYDGGVSLALQGKVDDVRVYNRALSVSEIKSLYNAGVGTKINSSQNVTGGSLDSGLVGFWSFNGPDTSGTTIYDKSASGNDGTLTAGASKTTGKVGQGVRFSGASSQYVNIPNGGGLDNLQTGSISLWVKWNGTQDLDTSEIGHYGAVIARQADGIFTNHLIALTGTNPETAFVTFGPYSNGPRMFSGTEVKNNTWRHLVVTYESGSQILYMDGVVDGTETLVGTIGNNLGSSLTIGAWIGDGGSFSSATVDEVRVYNRILTPAEAKQLYLMGR